MRRRLVPGSRRRSRRLGGRRSGRLHGNGKPARGRRTRSYAVFDSEELLDQRARRPQLRIVDGINHELDWPQVTLRVGADRLGSGIAMLAGPEPDMRWRSFSGAVAELAAGLGARLMVGFGGFPAGAPHTRPVKLAATASDGRVGPADRLRLGHPRGPRWDSGGDRAGLLETRDPFDRLVGAGAALCRRDAVSCGSARAARRAREPLGSRYRLRRPGRSRRVGAPEGRRAHQPKAASTRRWSASSSSRSTRWRRVGHGRQDCPLW